MAENYALRAILNIPKLTERQLRLLVALETVTRDGRGWREVSMATLMSYSNLSRNTVRKARLELIGRGMLEYREGGKYRGSLGAYRMPLIDLALPPGEGGSVVSPLPGSEGVTDVDPFPAPEGGTDVDPFHGPEGVTLLSPLTPGSEGVTNVDPFPAGRGQTGTPEGVKPDAVASANATGAYTYVLKEPTDPTVDGSLEGRSGPVDNPEPEPDDIMALSDEELAARTAEAEPPPEEPPW